MSNDLVVLYIEDESDIREVTEFALEDEGFELVSCELGSQAISQAQELKPDLLLLDVMMPGMDGPSTLKKLREFPHLANTPVIFMTAKVQAGELKEYEDMGAIGTIGKPFDPMTLADEIRNLLERNRA